MVASFLRSKQATFRTEMTQLEREQIAVHLDKYLRYGLQVTVLTLASVRVDTSSTRPALSVLERECADLFSERSDTDVRRKRALERHQLFPKVYKFEISMYSALCRFPDCQICLPSSLSCCS